MAHRLILSSVFGSFVLTISTLFCASAEAQVLWAGLTKTFTKTIGGSEQDVLTPNVILTRGGAGGLINIAAEGFYNQFSSPALTLWATDINNPGKTIAATNWQDLAFTNWINAYGGSHTGGAFIAERNAVVCLTSNTVCDVSANVILDLRFTAWASGGGGGFTYMRAEPPPSGDYNGDGIVNAADYVVWRKTLTQSASPAGSGADGNRSGSIDQGDYTYWRQRFGNPAVSGSGLSDLAVPEPASLGLLLVGSLLSLRRRGR